MRSMPRQSPQEDPATSPSFVPYIHFPLGTRLRLFGLDHACPYGSTENQNTELCGNLFYIVRREHIQSMERVIV